MTITYGRMVQLLLQYQGLSAGTYTVTVTDSVYGCVATASVTLTDPALLSASAIVVDAMPGQSDGSVDLTISGGTPHVLTGGSLNSHNPSHSSNGSSGVHFNIINTSSSDITVDGFSQGSYSYSGANSMNVYYMPGPYNPQTTTGWTQVATNVAQLFQLENIWHHYILRRLQLLQLQYQLVQHMDSMLEV